uniref:Uncharacterized protein n=1 Tax=Leersia perrieri TaxID=77586 RepID=A0A0D9WX98_9ORYZ
MVLPVGFLGVIYVAIKNKTAEISSRRRTYTATDPPTQSRSSAAVDCPSPPPQQQQCDGELVACGDAAVEIDSSC